MAMLECSFQGVAVVGIAGKATHTDDEPLVQRRGDADLAAELVAHPRLTLGDTVDFGFMQSVDFVGTLECLVKELRDQSELANNAIPQRDHPAATVADFLTAVLT